MPQPQQSLPSLVNCEHHRLSAPDSSMEQRAHFRFRLSPVLRMSRYAILTQKGGAESLVDGLAKIDALEYSASHPRVLGTPPRAT